MTNYNINTMAEATEAYENMLNETMPVKGLEFSTADVLLSMDYTAYQEGLNDYIDFLIVGGVSPVSLAE